MSKSYNFKGFTLLEVAIVLAIVGLLLAGGVNLLSGSADTSKYKQTQNELQEIKESLITYYIQYNRLPCPDAVAPFDGLADASCSTASAARGWLPYVTLGFGGNGDAWGERIKYVVSPAFLVNATSSFCTNYSNSPNGRNSPANRVIIQDLQSTPTTLGDWAAFALVSTGKNGRQTNAGMTGAFSNDGGCTGLSAREQENCNTDSTLRFGTQMSDGTTITFDDMVVWVGDMQLISQLRKSGVCDNF